MVQKVSQVINGAGKILAALHALQRVKYEGKTIAVATHVPTRWVILYLVAKSLKKTKDALRELVESEQWTELCKSAPSAKELTGPLGTGKLAPCLSASFHFGFYVCAHGCL